MRLAHLQQQLAHVLRARARCRLIRHADHPFDEIVLEQTGEAHQHQAHRAIAADEVLCAPRERRVDHAAIDRIKDDHRVVVHPQRVRGVDPVTVEAGGADGRVRGVRPIAALTGDDRVESLERFRVARIFQRARRLADCWRGAAR